MPPEDINPYASPAAADEPRPAPVVSTYQQLKELKRFRSEAHLLGGKWIVMGTLTFGLLAVGVFAASGPGADLIFMASFGLVGFAFLALGIGACYKQIWAFVMGLVLSYVLAVLYLLGFNLCMALIFAGSIFAAHRVISWVGPLRRKGIPLKMRPQDIETPIAIPPRKFSL